MIGTGGHPHGGFQEAGGDVSPDGGAKARVEQR